MRSFRDPEPIVLANNGPLLLRSARIAYGTNGYFSSSTGQVFGLRKRPNTNIAE